jgi:hypothetical protein
MSSREALHSTANGTSPRLLLHINSSVNFLHARHFGKLAVISEKVKEGVLAVNVKSANTYLYELNSKSRERQAAIVPRGCEVFVNRRPSSSSKTSP